MAGRIALVGGDEFRAGCEGMDRALLDATGVERPRVLVIPTAAAAENPSRAASNGVGYFSGLGADASALMVLDTADADNEEMLLLVDSAQVIYFTGGSPTHLLETLAESRLLHKVQQAIHRGAVLVGSSAGAMVMGPWMRYRGWQTALGIVPDVVTLPHHENSDPDAVARELAASAPADVTVLGIDVRTCCLSDANGWTVLGRGAVTTYNAGRWRRFATGESLTIGDASQADEE